MVKKLIELGFENVGRIKCHNEKPAFPKLKIAAEKILYAFVEDEQIMYIGKTCIGLEKRMAHYRRPGATQPTNIRVNAELLNCFKNDSKIDLYIFVGEKIISFKGYEVDLAAGLEDILIQKFRPKWNKLIRKDANYTENINYESKEKIYFDLKLVNTYFDKTYFNFPVKLSEFLGSKEQRIKIYLGNKSHSIIGKINRTAQRNKSPRIMGNSEMRKWINKNYERYEEMKIEILNKNEIFLFSKKVFNIS